MIVASPARVYGRFRAWRLDRGFLSSLMAGDPKIAYVLLRNAHFGPRLASSVELCVRDLALHSRYARSTLVVCPKIDKPFEGVEIAAVPDAGVGGNLAKALAVAALLRRRGIDLAVVENHLPAAALIAHASGARTLLHSHAYETAPRGAAARASARLKVQPLVGLVFVSKDCERRFRANFPFARAPSATVPNGLDMTQWSASAPKDKSVLVVGRALGDKGHVEAIAAIAHALKARPDWRARFILSAVDREPRTMEALREAASAFEGRVKIDANVPYAQVKAAWQRAAIGMVLTKTPEPFGRTALEALASGAALVTSGLGGLAEVCGSCAVTVDPQDAKRVAAGLSSLMDGPDRRAELARAGRERVEALFDIRAVARRMDEFVDRVLAGPGGAVG